MSDISKMDFKQLRNTVQSIQDEIAVMKRKYEDILYNLDYDNFSDRIVKENDKLKTMVSISAGKIETLVSDTDGLSTQVLQTAEEIKATAKYVSDNAKKISTVELTAEELSTQVTENKTDADSQIEELSSKITQTAEGITARVEASYNLANAESATSADDMTDTEKIYVIEKTNDDGTVTGAIYYHFNNITEEWEIISGDSIYTVFEQTSDGFILKGNVNISGDLITMGTISAERIDTENLSCTKLYAKDNPDKYYVKLNGSFGDFGIYSPLSAEEDKVNDSTCMFGVYNATPNVNFYVYSNNFLGYDVTNHKTWVKGVWDFSGDDVEVLGLTPIAVFG